MQIKNRYLFFSDAGNKFEKLRKTGYINADSNFGIAQKTALAANHAILCGKLRF